MRSKLKILGIAIILTLLMTLGLSQVAYAVDPPVVTTSETVTLVYQATSGFYAATINGSVVYSGSSSSWFEFGLTDAYGVIVRSKTVRGNGTFNQRIRVVPGVRYYYRAYVTVGATSYYGLGEVLTPEAERAIVLTVDDDVLPDTDNTYDLGSDTNSWKDGFFNGDLEAAGISGTSITDSGLTSGRLPIAGVGGLLGDTSSLTFTSSGAGQGLVVSKSLTDTADAYGIRGVLNVAATAPSASYFFADSNTVNLLAATSGNFTSSLHNYYARLDAEVGSASTVDFYRAFESASVLSGSTITYFTGYDVHEPIVNAPASITNLYGIKTERLTVGTTLNYGIYIGGGTTAALYVAQDPTYLGGTTELKDTVTVANNKYLRWLNSVGAGQDILTYSNTNSTRLTSPGGVLYLNPSIATEIQMWGGASGTGRLLYIVGTASSAGTTTQDSPSIVLKARYWNGSDTGWDYSIVHDMTAVTPASTVYHKINDVTVLSFTNTNGTLTSSFGTQALTVGSLYSGVNQVVGARVTDARADDAINSGDATTDGVIDALRDAMITHGLIAP